MAFGMFGQYCHDCKMPIEPGDKVRRDTKNNAYHARHSVSSEEAAKVYLEAFSNGLLWFGGTKPKQNYPQDNR